MNLNEHICNINGGVDERVLELIGVTENGWEPKGNWRHFKCSKIAPCNE